MFLVSVWWIYVSCAKRSPVQYTVMHVSPGSDKEDQLSQRQHTGFSQAMAPTAAQHITPGLLDAGSSRDDGTSHLSSAGPNIILPAVMTHSMQWNMYCLWYFSQL